MTTSAVSDSRLQQSFDLDAGSLPLDFTNTLDDRADATPDEHLPDYLALLDFAVVAGIISVEQRDVLSAAAAADPAGAARVHAAALVLREALFRIVTTVIAGESPAPDDIDALNSAHARAIVHGGVVPAASGAHFAWRWEDDVDLARPLWPVARAAVELLLTADLQRLRECAADNCRWLFLDTTRNRSRRWCSMQTCGNRAKVHEFRRRARDGGDG